MCIIPKNKWRLWREGGQEERERENEMTTSQFAKNPGDGIIVQTNHV